MRIIDSEVLSLFFSHSASARSISRSKVRDAIMKVRRRINHKDMVNKLFIILINIPNFIADSPKNYCQRPIKIICMSGSSIIVLCISQFMDTSMSPASSLHPVSPCEIKREKVIH